LAVLNGNSVNREPPNLDALEERYNSKIGGNAVQTPGTILIGYNEEIGNFIEQKKEMP